MSTVFAVREASLTDPQLRDLIALHLAGMHANSPPDSVFALDLSGLSAADVTVWGAWAENGRLAAMGAMKLLGRDQAEVKSMRTHPDFLCRGAGAAILEAIIAKARTAGVITLSLETGSGESFEPALSLYRKRGFTNGAAFGDYTPSMFNQFLHLRLD